MNQSLRRRFFTLIVSLDLELDNPKGHLPAAVESLGDMFNERLPLYIHIKTVWQHKSLEIPRGEKLGSTKGRSVGLGSVVVVPSYCFDSFYPARLPQEA